MLAAAQTDSGPSKRRARRWQGAPGQNRSRSPAAGEAIAVRVHENLPVHVDLDDLIHAGILGLFDAASKYDPTRRSFFIATQAS